LTARRTAATEPPVVVLVSRENDGSLLDTLWRYSREYELRAATSSVEAERTPAAHPQSGTVRRRPR
jgi:hypothetical protein